VVPAFVRPLSFARSKLQELIEGSGTPANAGHQPPHLAMRRAPFWSAHACRRSTAALASGSISSLRLGFRPGFLGLGLHGRYPPSPVPAQGCTSHPGRNAGRNDAQAARERTANPPAGTALAPMPRCASAPCPSPERGLREPIYVADRKSRKSESAESLRGTLRWVGPKSRLLEFIWRR